MILFRHCDRRWPFLWETAVQPEARWNAQGDGPTQYLADTPDGAWAEFLRHEEITDPADLEGVSRALWCVDLDVDVSAATVPDLPRSTMTGDPTTYPDCQAEARRLRDSGVREILVPSAALLPRGATGYRVERGFRRGPEQDGQVLVAFGRRPEAVGWQVVDQGRPPVELLVRVRPLTVAVTDAPERP